MGGPGSGPADAQGPRGDLRTVVRDELIGRQLDVHLPAEPCRVLDVGAGPGSQALRLARLGHDVVVAEPDPSARAALGRLAAREPPDVRARLTSVPGALGSLDVGDRYDVVCCHSALMHLGSARAAVVELCDLVAAGGVVSLVARNADGLAWRPGRRRQWQDVLTALDDARGASPAPVDELGSPARADRLEELASFVAGRRMHVEAWYGVRVLTDGDDVDRPAPDEPELGSLLAAEERVGRTDPYRRLAALLHVVGRRDERAGPA